MASRVQIPPQTMFGSIGFFGYGFAKNIASGVRFPPLPGYQLPTVDEIAFVVGNLYKPSFATVAGWGRFNTST